MTRGKKVQYNKECYRVKTVKKNKEGIIVWQERKLL